ncbi:hypothetical protein pEaSNUABM35_00100 [Erwinia phage pEa_SNUABM_35]|uniref:Uncharacterized protein n=1 Tax=Erwinia phage pEa_SNUABM_35 TaxID=2869557 RepID=A0AAE7XQZ5_9CAUD|nr:hypothetical protein MPK65_gp100 [Erwinia phage pEa_SNUABM_35]QZE60017.1 hypothetical protein pEaSNUABM35_00100 [Erwinia phage pEa_SNUABM_35]QZE60353.1 hypothetical protein pEaSNUABM36_00100 [Erwinia phage pEa_SNUABM_36]
MPAYARLAFKDPSRDRWVANLAYGGTKVRWQDTDGTVRWIRMTVNNTKVKNPEAGQSGQPDWTTLTG